MRPQFSEFTYGFALTHTLIRASHLNLWKAPIFPSLRDEGKRNGGYDVKLRLPLCALFLQFKVSHSFSHGNAREARSGLIPLPYYRIHLRTRRGPSRDGRKFSQHDLLLDLGKVQNCVYYVAPAFNSSKEFDDYYLKQELHRRSFWLRPAHIGRLPGNKDHSVAFDRALQRAFFCSSPAELSGPFDFDRTVAQCARVCFQRESAEPGRVTLQRLLDTLVEFAWDAEGAGPSSIKEMIGMISGRHLVEQVAFLARVLGDVQLYIAQRTQ